MTYLAKIGELTLKGSNLQEFENLLKHNTAKYLEGTGAKVSLRAGRLYIECEENGDLFAGLFYLRDLFFCVAGSCNNDRNSVHCAV